MQRVISRKEEHCQKALSGRWNIGEAVMIGGNVFAIGYLAFQGAQIIKPALAAMPAVGAISMACGAVGGMINIGVALVCLKEGIQAFRNGDNKLAIRLFIDFVTLLGIGAVMVLASLAARIPALGTLSVFFSTHPWVLPVLFFILSIPIIAELTDRLYHIHSGKSLGAQLLSQNLDALIHGERDDHPLHLQPLIDQADQNDTPTYALLSRKMEQLQADMGIEAAIATFKLLRLRLLREDTEQAMKEVKQKIHEWNHAQHVRLLQQMLYTASFGVSLATLNPRINTPTLNAATSLVLAGGNTIPLYMDTFWPFKRNTPIVVPNALEAVTA